MTMLTTACTLSLWLCLCFQGAFAIHCWRDFFRFVCCQLCCILPNSMKLNDASHFSSLNSLWFVLLSPILDLCCSILFSDILQMFVSTPPTACSSDIENCESLLSPATKCNRTLQLFDCPRYSHLPSEYLIRQFR
jgi:hypothetical protein